MKQLKESGHPMSEVLPQNSHWIKEWVVKFDPEKNHLVTNSGQEVGYEYLVIAMGLQLDYDLVKPFEN